MNSNDEILINEYENNISIVEEALQLYNSNVYNIVCIEHNNKTIICLYDFKKNNGLTDDELLELDEYEKIDYEYYELILPMSVLTVVDDDYYFTGESNPSSANVQIFNYMELAHEASNIILSNPPSLLYYPRYELMYNYIVQLQAIIENNYAKIKKLKEKEPSDELVSTTYYSPSNNKN